jgi:hypothetical protein
VNVKGGENVHFRHFIISGLVVGATLLLPNNAFAEKNELSGQNAQKSSGQSVLVETAHEVKNATVHGKNTEAHDKTVVIPQTVSNDQVRETPKVTPIQAVSSKTAKRLKSLPEKTKKAVQKGKDKIVKAPGLEKVTAGLNSARELVENEKKHVIKTKTGEKAISSLPKKPSELKTNSLVHKAEVKEENSKLLKSGVKMRSERFATSPPKKESKVPKLPKEDPVSKQILNVSPQSNSSGGKSKDRMSYGGLSSTNMVDKWMEWNKFYENQLILPYVSRNAMMSNQWMNAPPSPPPQEAPYLISINRP